ncbi:256_t:CDS:1, partial [Gigaspora rosea]
RTMNFGKKSKKGPNLYNKQYIKWYLPRQPLLNGLDTEYFAECVTCTDALVIV